MRVNSHIRKILLLSLALVLGAGLLVLLVAAINKKHHKNCTGIDIIINSRGEDAFLNRAEVLALVAPDKNNAPKGKPLASFDLKRMEAALKQHVWIRDAQLFFDNNGVLRITVEERQPVARIFTAGGNSFYIDSSGKHLPLSNRLMVKLPVFSNFPAEKETLYGADSVLLAQVKQISPFIKNNPFWMAQIAQVDITPNRSFEMIPVIGKHIIAFGDGSNYEEKFHRLMLFYQQVGARAGLDKYSIIDVQYDNQVVATKKGVAGKIDSLQAIKNIQKMIETSRQQLINDTLSTTVDNNIVVNAAPSPTLTILKEHRENLTAKDSLNKVPTSTNPISLKSRARLPVVQAKVPKAVMRKPHG